MYDEFNCTLQILISISRPIRIKITSFGFSYHSHIFSHYYNDLIQFLEKFCNFCFLNPLLRSFNNFWFSLADKVTRGTYNFVPLIVKITLLALSLPLSLPFPGKTQYFVHLSFNSIFQLLNGISSALQKLLKQYFNGKAISACFRIPSWVIWSRQSNCVS